MKTKPTRHKESNTFQFKTFSERVSEIDVDVFHRVAHRNEVDYEEVETYFHQTLQKWNFLNLTEGYCSFKKEVRSIVTLPQLINQKQFIIDTLIEYLEKKDVLFLQPILELVVAVSKDLQKEFYEYFPRFLNVIIDLLRTKDAEQIEYTFTCLAYLFKFLWRYLVKNAKTVFDLLLPLLADTQPDYINSFAAESFAFVVRKVKDKVSFLNAVLHTLEDNPNGVPGCGKLLFEVISGTPGQFHSCTEQMLSLYFNALNDESVNQGLTFKVLKEIVNCFVQHIHPQKCDIFWSVLLSIIDTSVEKTKHFQLGTEREKSLILIIRLLCIVINYKNGRFVTDPVPLVKKLIQTLDIFENDNDVLREIINAVVAILLAANVKLTQETSSQILMKVMAVKDVKLLYSAVESLIHYSSFETLVLPQILRQCVSTGFNDDSLQLFAKIIKAKSPPCLNGINLDKWKKYILDIRGFHSMDYLLKELELVLGNNLTTNALKILIILPHLKPLPEEFKGILQEAIMVLYKQILSDSITDSDLIKSSFTFLLASESAVHSLEPDALLFRSMVKGDIKILDLIIKYPNNKLLLNAVDLYMTYFSTSQYRKMYINQTVFDTLNNSIAQKLSSPFSEVRLVVTHLYSLFSDVREITSDTSTEKTAMELIHLAEREPVTVQSYRDKLLHLQSLTFESTSVSSLDPKYCDFPLKYLLGTLYINFSLLWEPVSKIIATYATKECEQFWSIFLTELQCNHEPSVNYVPLFDCNVISEVEAAVQKSNDRPDYENHKILLWKCMVHFSHFCEMKNRDITGLFIDYVNNNFFKSNSEDAKCCSILKIEEPNASDNAMEIDVQEDGDSESEEDEKEEKEEKEGKEAIISKTTKSKQIFKPSKNYKLKLLVAQLEIFDKITNPKTLYRESEMQKIYLDLLSSKNPDIQKAALSCLLTYKHKYLLPYKDNLRNLIDEKNLKNELTRFKIDKDSNMIQDEHRGEFIPILMRIIYAKMVSKTGMRTGGKGGGFMKRKMILRFLAGSEENEMIVFTKMAFKPFKKYMTLEMEEKVKLKQLVCNIISTVDLNNVIPPKRLQSTVNLLAILIEQFGSKMEEKLLPYLLGLVMCILAEVRGILQKSDKVHVGFLSSIRNVRSSCILILARFFSHFENYQWNEHEIDALFDVAVFPWLEKLPIEGIHSPTPLLKLFIAWSQNSRYYPLFIKYREDDKSVSPLPYIIKLLLGTKTHASVVNAILEMIEKMVTLQDYGKTNENDMDIDTPVVPLIPVLTNLLEVNEETLSSGVNYGSTILLPHVFSILQHIKYKLEKSNRGVNKTELTILSRISEFVKDADACDTLLTLLVPILVRKATVGTGEETIIELITTVRNLIKHIKKPEIHIRAILPLLGTLSAAPARKLFLELFKTIAESSTEDYRETLIQNYNIINTLNAWDRRWIDQPDFQKRLDAFTEIKNAVEKDDITLEFGVAVIYNCYYFLKNEADLAMRDYSGQCLKLIGPKLAKKHRENILDRRYLMDETILVLVRKGIVSKNEVVRLHSIGFLGHMAMECPEVHPVLRDLSPLTNKTDPEVDFFENMQHLQLHRRARALLKFCNLAKTLKKAPNPRALTQFILPLASSYVCNETFIQKHGLIEAAIETIGTVCRLLPWHQYEIILKYYLGKLRRSVEYQRQLVRIIVIILDSFHFDLTKYKPVEEPLGPRNAEETTKIETISDKKEEEKDEKVTEEENEENIDQEAEEKLNEALNSESVENVEEIVEKKEVQEDVLVMEKQLVLSQYGARRVVFSISKELLPQLHRSIVARTSRENSHKVNKKKAAMENEEEELMRVPIALALVKLLQKLPERILDINLPGIFMKLCAFLKSRLISVRRITREVLQKIMITLGPKYLHHLLREMNTLLTKGFQVHVLAYTVQAVLVSLKPYFQKFDINQNLQSILSVCKVDLFGLSAEEKEVIGIVKNVTEAQSTKSFDIFHILAQYITESCLVDLILPLKEVLMRTHSHKTVQKVAECLRNVVLGLADNTFIPLEQMLIFLYGIVSDSIPDLLPEKKDKQFTGKEAEALAREKPDSFIIPPQPKSKMGIKIASKTSKNTNAHVITEFGLRLFHILLKRDKICNAEFIVFIDPFVPLITDCLKSQHVKLSTLGLQCLHWLLKMDLSSVQEAISDICSSIFNILHKYAAAGLSKGDNFDLVMAAFKCMSVIVRDVKHYTITVDQLKALMMYAEQDMHDSDKQATAFRLLKAIIARKMFFPEMYLVMNKVAALSITSELEHVKVQCRSVFYSYLMEYPLGKHLHKHILFYLNQLSYEMQPGRLSALEMLHSIITGFPLKILLQKSGLIFVMTGVRLINDDDPTCRKLCAKCIKEMITRIPYNKRSKLFDVTVEWLNDSKIMHRTLAAQLCGIFVTVEKDNFESRLKEILPILLKQFYANFDDKDRPGRFVKLHTPQQTTRYEMQPNIKDPERMMDHHMFQVLQLLLKISANCSAFLKNEEYKESISSFAEYSQSLLAHPHLWVRLAASQMLGFILAVLDVDKIIDLLENPEKCETETTYMYSDPTAIIRSLSLDLIAQLQPDMSFEELADQTVKNLIFIARILKTVNASNMSTAEQDEEAKDKDKTQISLPWLVRRLRKAVNIEIAQFPKSMTVRTAFFKWVAGAVATIPIEYLNVVLFNIMTPIVREISPAEETNTALRRLAKEAAKMIKKCLGNEEYTRLLSRVQQNLDIKKAEKRKMRTQQFVTDPELATRRKIARQQKKKEAKKRKLDTERGKKVTKRRPKKEVDLEII